ncbi:YlxM family DNA-binding protein [Spiroplasma tabanidicola]|uniref:UPF0122 protein STABA_v1c08540 n=1 Tax=Spiroplasma tabanidicola TaxID=324079 RepID=A0A6I6C9T0_9MOLU|nr:sigma factor-like helix-turn-helix DNA-binding protein [Spiroplasma tabanidicola]QGS52209.1 DNA-binding protein [Spiroplasma tabanidicola]
MSNINKNEEISSLYDYYKELLTEKQKEYFELYYFEDLTFQEIGEQLGISKNAVFDSINKTINNLKDFENKLHIKEKNDFIKQQIDNFKESKINIEVLIRNIEEEI